MNYKGIEYLKRKLKIKRARVKLRYDYYEMKNYVDYTRGMIPYDFQFLASCLGWCSNGVDSLADRLVFHDFDDDLYGLSEIYNMNNKDVLIDNMALSALISSCCFVYIAQDETGYPRLQIIDGANATGELDETTGLLTEGYAVLKRDRNEKILLDAYFITGKTIFTDYEKNETFEISNIAPAPLLVPVIYRPDAKRPFGHSRISRACMDLQKEACRTLFRASVSSEFYSIPQKYILGLDENTEFDNRAASISSFLYLFKDTEGGSPTIGQFTQQSMSPYIDQMQLLASLFAGEMGLTTEDLGFPGSQPSTSEAIKASHEKLRLTARKAQRTFGVGILNAGYLAACLRDNMQYKRNELYNTKLIWNPIFEPDAACLSGIGDGLLKIEQAKPGYITDSKMYDMIGV